jgi:hypothetical protein
MPINFTEGIYLPPAGRSNEDHFIYLHGHALRSIGFEIKFGKAQPTGFPVIVSAPSAITSKLFASFFMNPYGNDYSAAFEIYDDVKERLSSLKDTPAVSTQVDGILFLEFGGVTVISCETVAHVIRSRACYEIDEIKRNALLKEAIKVYEGVILSTGQPIFIKYLKHVNKRSASRIFTGPVDLPTLPLGVRRVITDTFAGLALCYLMGGEGDVRFISCMSFSVAISHQPLELAATLRQLVILTAVGSSAMPLDARNKFAAWLGPATDKVLLPTMLQARRQDLVDYELKLVQAEGDRLDIGKLAIELAGPNSSGYMRSNSNSFVVFQCAACGAESRERRQCSRCRTVYYCNRECQKAHWNEHKAVCGK